MIRSCTIHELPASWYGDAAAKPRPTRRRNFRADMAFFFFSTVAGFSFRLLANIDTRTQCRIGLYKIQEATGKTQAAWKSELPAIIVGTPLFAQFLENCAEKSKNTEKEMFWQLQRSEHFSARSGFPRGKWHVRGEKRARESEKGPPNHRLPLLQRRNFAISWNGRRKRRGILLWSRRRKKTFNYIWELIRTHFSIRFLILEILDPYSL